MSHAKFVVAVGISLENIAQYTEINSVVGYGVASAIANKKLIAEGNYRQITNISKAFVGQVK